MTTHCHILGCDLPADIADVSLDLCARHYRQSSASPYDWPAATADTLRAALATDRERRQSERLAELIARHQ